MEGKPHAPLDWQTAAMWNEYQRLAELRHVREHLGMSVAEWDDQPAIFTDWALQFWRLQFEPSVIQAEQKRRAKSG